MNRSENPFCRQKTCGGCMFGLVDSDAESGMPALNQGTNRTFVVEEGRVLCSLPMPLDYWIDRNALVDATGPCRFDPSQYRPLREGPSDRFFRLLRTSARMIGKRISRIAEKPRS